MSRARLASLASVVLAVVLLAGLGWIGWLLYDSRLPGSYNAMDLAVPDYGGGVHASHGGMSGRTIEQLHGPEGLVPDFRRTLIARRATVDLQSGRRIQALTYEGRVPGPELVVRQGDLVEVTLVNEDISEGVAIHWHGVDLPNREDGVPGVTQDAVRPGERYTYRFRAEQVGTFWYHSHQTAAKQVRRGLYGALVILPAKPDAKTVDVTAIAHTFPGAVVLNSSDRADRRVVRPGTHVRVRLVNSDSSARRFRLAGTPFRVVAIDGTDLNGPTPVQDRELELGSGARYDVAFTMPRLPVKLEAAGSQASIVFVTPQGGKEPVPRPSPVFDPVGYGAAASTPFFAESRFDRSFTVAVGRKLGFLDGKPGSHWSINGKLYPKVPMYVVRAGELIRMTVTNDSGATHPMHLHGHHVLVLSRNGQRATGSPLWLDTLNVRDGERYEIGFRADNPGLWMEHCHNLPHAAEGLTTHVVYEGVSTPYRAGDAARNHPE
jgi:FtsP/CotA-like multicopper oxidase with cupredoxin domain